MPSLDVLTIQQVRDEGLPEEVAPDPQVARAISLATRYISLVTETWFVPLDFTTEAPLLLDGNGSDVLPLPAPIIRLDSVTEGGADVSLDDLAIYARSLPGVDDRRYPRLVKKAPPMSFGAYGGGPVSFSGASRRRVSGPPWGIGQQNVALVGRFGFVESDETPPADIQVAALRLVLREYRLQTDPDSREARQSGAVISETTPGHSYTLAGLVSSAGPTGDRGIDDILGSYRRPFMGSSR